MAYAILRGYQRMRIGPLRRRITLQRNYPTQAADGSRVDDFRTVATVWGDLKELRGSEYLAAREAHSETTAKILIRYRDDIRPEWRAVHAGRIFDVQHVVDMAGRHRLLELMVAEIR